jgi:hypothetical protein
VLFINKSRRGELFAGKLASQVWGRWASTQPYEYLDWNSSDEQSLTSDNYMIPLDDPKFGLATYRKSMCFVNTTNIAIARKN